MKTSIILLLTFLFTIVVSAQDTTSAKMQMPMKKMMNDSMHAKMHKGKTFTCPMHTEVMQDHPGKCPKCGMDLVENSADTSAYCPMCKEKTTLVDGCCAQCGKIMNKYGDKAKSSERYMCTSCDRKDKKSGKCAKCGGKMKEPK